MTTAQRAWNGKDRVNFIWLSTGTATLEKSEEIETEIRNLLAKKHNFDPEDRDALGMYNNNVEYSRIMKMLTWIKIFVFIPILVLLLSVISDLCLNGITWLWFKISEVLGWINSRILLGVVFFIILVPISFIARLLNKTAIKLKKSNDSYYKVRNHSYTPEDIENMW